MQRYLLCIALMFTALIAFSQELVPPLYRQYATQAYMKQLLASHPEMVAARSAIEQQTFDFLRYGLPDTPSIAVVVHLVGVEASSITMADVEAQMSLLNKDFYMPEFPATETISESWTAEGFQDRAAKPSIRFCLATQTPSGGLTQGVIYANSQVASFAVSDAITTIEGGGSLAWNTANYLNIWVAPLDNNIAGFAQMPGGPSSSDGVVINSAFFARADQQAYISANPQLVNYAGGKTLSHLVASYLNLYELWNDEIRCADDLVDDTPIHNAPNYDKPIYRQVSTCGDNPVEMTMNIMDNTDDEILFMFTNGQMLRMYATLNAENGPRAGLRTLSSQCELSGGLELNQAISERNDNQVNDKQSSIGLQLFPNPANDGFTIVVTSPCEEKMYIDIFDHLGLRCYQNAIDVTHMNSMNEIYVDSKGWSLGMHLVRVHCGTETASSKIIIEH